MDSTYPNRHYQWRAQNGRPEGERSSRRETPTTGFNWETILDRAHRARARRSRYYVSDLPVRGALRHHGGSPGLTRSSQFYADAAAGKLPPISLRRPRRSATAAGGNGDLRRRAPARRHPPGAGVHVRRRPRLHASRRSTGAARCSSTTTSGAASSTTCKPRHVPDDRANRGPRRGLGDDRVPDPRRSRSRRSRAPAAGVSHMTGTHESILKLISYRYRARLPEQAPPLRLQHRAQLRLRQAATSSRRSSPTRRRSPRCPARRRQRRGRRSTTWPSSRARGCWSGSATRCPRSPTNRCSATRTRCGEHSSRAAEERKRAPGMGPFAPKGRSARVPAAGPSVLQL